MKIRNDSETQKRRDTWRRLCPATATARLRFDRPTKTPPITFAELLARLSRGRLGPEVAGHLLRIDAKCISLYIEIDRETGLVSHWNMRTHGGGARDAKTVTDKKSPAA